MSLKWRLSNLQIKRPLRRCRRDLDVSFRSAETPQQPSKTSTRSPPINQQCEPSPEDVSQNLRANRAPDIQWPTPSLRASNKDSTATPLKRCPRTLLVDDNKTNLRLLETLVKRRKYPYIDTAEDGKLALEAAESRPEGYDINFMSMFMSICAPPIP